MQDKLYRDVYSLKIGLQLLGDRRLRGGFGPLGKHFPGSGLTGQDLAEVDLMIATLRDSSYTVVISTRIIVTTIHYDRILRNSW